MRLSGFLLPTVVGLVRAASPAAEAYILQASQSTHSDSAPSISADVAQAILQQRLGVKARLPCTIAESDYAQVAHYGKTAPDFFADASESEPRQLVIVLKNAEESNLKELRNAISTQEPTFRTPQLDFLPSSYIPSRFNGHCSLENVLDANSSKKCWAGKTLYVEYDVVQDKQSVKTLAKSFARLQEAAGVEASASRIETTVVLLPSASTPNLAIGELRRREFFETEEVLTESIESDVAFSSASSGVQDQSPNLYPFASDKKVPIPACFTSQAACENTTNSCSGHGTCENKYNDDAATACFSCRCLKTEHSTRHWGGNACQKIDISTPFWLFVGFTIFIVGAVGFSISLLFSVGEEKLPGVIGAGVSRGATK